MQSAQSVWYSLEAPYLRGVPAGREAHLAETSPSRCARRGASPQAAAAALAVLVPVGAQGVRLVEEHASERRGRVAREQRRLQPREHAVAHHCDAALRDLVWGRV